LGLKGIAAPCRPQGEGAAPGGSGFSAANLAAPIGHTITSRRWRRAERARILVHDRHNGSSLQQPGGRNEVAPLRKSVVRAMHPEICSMRVAEAAKRSAASTPRVLGCFASVLHGYESRHRTGSRSSAASAASSQTRICKAGLGAAGSWLIWMRCETLRIMPSDTGCLAPSDTSDPIEPESNQRFPLTMVVRRARARTHDSQSLGKRLLTPLRPLPRELSSEKVSGRTHSAACAGALCTSLESGYHSQ